MTLRGLGIILAGLTGCDGETGDKPVGVAGDSAQPEVSSSDDRPDTGEPAGGQDTWTPPVPGWELSWASPVIGTKC